MYNVYNMMDGRTVWVARYSSLADALERKLRNRNAGVYAWLTLNGVTIC